MGERYMEGKGEIQVKLPETPGQPFEPLGKDVLQKKQTQTTGTKPNWGESAIPTVAEATADVKNYKEGSLARQKAKTTLVVSKAIEASGIPTEELQMTPPDREAVTASNTAADKKDNSQRGQIHKKYLGLLTAASLAISACTSWFGIHIPIGVSSNPTPSEIVEPSSSPVPTPYSSGSPIVVPSELPSAPASPEVSPTQGPEVSASAETQAELDKAVKDWLDGTTKTPEPIMIGGQRQPFHVLENSIMIENMITDPGAQAEYQFVYLGGLYLDGHLIFVGGTENADGTRHALILEAGKTSEEMTIETAATNAIGTQALPHEKVSVSDALAALSKYQGKAILAYALISTVDPALLTANGIDPEVNQAVPTSLAIARWQADPNKFPQPNRAAIDSVPRTFDITQLSPIRTITVIGS